MRCLPRLLGVRLELLFQRRELGKRRIRIGFLVAAVPAVTAPLDVLRAQRRIAIRTIAARRPVGAVATVLAALLVIAALRATRALRTLGAPLVGTIRALMTLRALVAIGARFMAAVLLGRRRSVGRPCRGRSRSVGADCRRAIGGGGSSGDGRRVGLPLRPARARRTLGAWLARMVLLTAAGPPNLDEFF
jgi:hypothetical protein